MGVWSHTSHLDRATCAVRSYGDEAAEAAAGRAGPPCVDRAVCDTGPCRPFQSSTQSWLVLSLDPELPPPPRSSLPWFFFPKQLWNQRH